MTTPPLFPGFDGLMTLSRREGVDIRPTLLRVLTDLYVQARAHSDDEARQFVELTSRLIDQVDDATRAAVRARLAIYPATPAEISKLLGLKPADPGQVPSPPRNSRSRRRAAPVKPPTEAQLRMASNLSMRPNDAAEINDMFFARRRQRTRADPAQSAETPLRASARIPAARAARAVETLEMAAFAADIENFTLELGDTLILPARVAAQVVNDPGGEPLACAAQGAGHAERGISAGAAVSQSRTWLIGPHVYRVSRLYDRLSERSALIMLAAWRGSTMAATRAKYRPSSTTTNVIAPARQRHRTGRRYNPAACREPARRARNGLGKLKPAPDRESAVLPGPRSRRSRRRGRT